MIRADLWTLRLPPVELGTGCVEKLPRYLGGCRRALLVTGRRAMKAAGVTDRVLDLVRGAGVECRAFDGISAEPEAAEIEAAAARGRDFRADAVIGLGGGSAMDAAKAVAVAATHPGPILDYALNGPRPITAAALPVLAVSSTSGTGSHVGRVAVVSVRAEKLKRPLISDFLYPRAAFCDPAITRTMPAEVTASTGWDAFAQALEGYLSRVEHPLGTLCAGEAMRAIYRTLPAVLRDGGDLDLRARMAWGDTMAGVSLATNTVVIPHVIAMVLGGRYGISHGRAIAAVTVACLRHSRPGAVPKLARIARLLGCSAPLGDDGLADWAIDAIARFIAEIGMEGSPAGYGVPEGDHESIAREVNANFRMRIDSDPVPTDAAGLVRILRSADAKSR